MLDFIERRGCWHTANLRDEPRGTDQSHRGPESVFPSAA